ncbi:hypothetical protein ACFLSJ_01295 [Verrucomicrobiota bacterium]
MDRLGCSFRRKPVPLIAGAGLSLILAPAFISLATAQVIIDNADGAPTCTLTGSWTLSDKAGQYGADVRFTNEDGATAVFTPDLPAAGMYRVEMWWPSQDMAFYAHKGDIRVNHAGGVTDVRIDQSDFGSRWMGVGYFPFAAGTSGSVTARSIVGSGGGWKIVADAVRFSTDSPTGMVFAASSRDGSTAAYSETGAGGGLSWRDFSHDHRGTSLTGDSARFEFGTGPPLGTYEITLFRDGHYNANRIMRVWDGASQLSEFTLGSGGNTVLGSFTFAIGPVAVEMENAADDHMGVSSIELKLLALRLRSAGAALVVR